MGTVEHNGKGAAVGGQDGAALTGAGHQLETLGLHATSQSVHSVTKDAAAR